MNLINIHFSKQCYGKVKIEGSLLNYFFFKKIADTSTAKLYFLHLGPYYLIFSRDK
jgi:hypothetical protein